MHHSSLLSDLIDLHAALRADAAVALEARKPRDRHIGSAVQQDRHSPVKQLRGWLDRVDIPGWRRTGHAGAQLHQVLSLVLGVLGLASGWGLARAVLHYTGDAPINIVHALVVLILPQLLLLGFWLLAVIPYSIPLIRSLQTALRFLHPGRLTRRLAERLPGAGRQQLEMVWDPENAVVLAPAARWLFSFWSQLFAFAFNLGVLSAVFYLITFSDLAFGWSTTLNVHAETFHRLVNALAWPWHRWLPDAVPSAELVQTSRYFRIEPGAAGAGQAALLGSWWPFLVAAVVCYGLLPRLLTLLISWQRWRHHLRRALPRLPGAPELLARMNSPLVRTAAPQPEALTAPETGDSMPGEHPLGGKLSCAVVAWSGSVDDPEALFAVLPRVGIEPSTLLHAGGAQSTEQDRATIAALCRERAQGVAIVAKAWEPPLLEFVDFLHSVRAQCRRAQPIVVLLRGGGEPVNDTDAEVWRLTLRRLKDPDLHIESIP